MKFELIEVEAYSGHRLNERPLSFVFRGKIHEVREVRDRWHEGGQEPGTPQLSYFKVITTEGQEFLLRYNSPFDAWAILIND